MFGIFWNARVCKDIFTTRFFVIPKNLFIFKSIFYMFKKQITFWLIYQGLKASADMSAKNAFIGGTAPLTFHNTVELKIHMCYFADYI